MTNRDEEIRRMRARHSFAAIAKLAVVAAAGKGRLVSEAWATRDTAFRKKCSHEFEPVGDSGLWEQCVICARCRKVGSTKVLGVTDVLKCCECGDVHKGVSRLNRNGSHSECPKCGHGVYAWP